MLTAADAFRGNLVVQIATSPILVLVGVLIFASSVPDINWDDYTDVIPVLVTTTISEQRSTAWLRPVLSPACHLPDAALLLCPPTCAIGGRLSAAGYREIAFSCRHPLLSALPLG